MTRSLKTLRLIGLLASSVVFGLTLSHVLESPGNRALDGAAWLSVQHTFYGGFAIVGGVAEVIGFAATTTDAVISRRRPRAALAPALAALCPLGTLLSYFFGNRPLNTKVARLDGGNASRRLVVLPGHLGDRPRRLGDSERVCLARPFRRDALAARSRHAGIANRRGAAQAEKM
jgi:hypothetical protein